MPNMARAQRLKETANTADSAERPADGNPQAEARLRRFQPYKSVSRETFLSDLDPKPYMTEDSGFTLNLVRSVDFLVQFGIGRRRRFDGHNRCCEFAPV
jgi:hypothetical protein